MIMQHSRPKMLSCLQKRSEATADTVSFLSLPPELRNYIYELTIETNRDINFLSVATTGRH